MESFDCPVCHHVMHRRPSAMDAHQRVFVCDHCHAELRQMLSRAPEATAAEHCPPIEGVGDGEPCPFCEGSDLFCIDCGDGVCEEHVRTVDKYAGVFSAELGQALVDRYGGKLFCPLCFRATMNRFSSEVGEGLGRSKPRSFNLPIILGLFALLLVLMLGVDQCGAPIQEVSGGILP